MGKLPETHFKGEKGGALLDFIKGLKQLLIVKVSTLLERMRHATLILQEIGSLCVWGREREIREKGNSENQPPELRNPSFLSHSYMGADLGLGTGPSLRVDNEKLGGIVDWTLKQLNPGQYPNQRVYACSEGWEQENPRGRKNG